MPDTDQLDLEDFLKALPSPKIGGRTFVPSLDADRLNTQYGRILDLMLDGCWRTYRQIANATGDPENSIGARLRDVRKSYGEDAMQSRRVPGSRPKSGVWEYRLNIKEPS